MPSQKFCRKIRIAFFLVQVAGTSTFVNLKLKYVGFISYLWAILFYAAIQNFEHIALSGKSFSFIESIGLRKLP